MRVALVAGEVANAGEELVDVERFGEVFDEAFAMRDQHTGGGYGSGPTGASCVSTEEVSVRDGWFRREAWG